MREQRNWAELLKEFLEEDNLKSNLSPLPLKLHQDLTDRISKEEFEEMFKQAVKEVEESEADR